jgi:hypothetical protein
MQGLLLFPAPSAKDWFAAGYPSGEGRPAGQASVQESEPAVFAAAFGRVK